MNIPIPYVVEQSSRGERSYDIYSRLLKDRIVFVGSEINDAVANSIIARIPPPSRCTAPPDGEFRIAPVCPQRWEVWPARRQRNSSIDMP